MSEELAEIVASFQIQFGNDEACVPYLFQIKWPDGYSCPRCGHRHAYTINTRRLPLYECRGCRHQSSLIAGTVMEGSRTELYKWFTAIHLISRTEIGTSAVQLSHAINVTYKTAWLMLHKIRHAMSLADHAMLLSGIVQVNAAVYGAPHNSTTQFHHQEHPVLVGAAIDDQGQPTHFKIKVVPRTHLKERMISTSGCKVFADQYVARHARTVEIVTGRFSRNRSKALLALATDANEWINTTFHGVGRKHLQAYMDEFAYRRNLSLYDKSIFPQLLQHCINSSSVTYSKLSSLVPAT
ncbi:IS1595 family transposase ISClba3 [Paenibacillus solanacearum]|uniref:IS1595 family transposase ISClba3 n=1 Tax=Paenibacillus solanacearum TaxID=2048548 RepID=A0A916KAB3_9BACL|nr:transposase [Paenibacillus solanacearum]CAG7651444.1 IS1595 family transposase ISClba3 [Paenibacillus solanacearum]